MESPWEILTQVDSKIDSDRINKFNIRIKFVNKICDYNLRLMDIKLIFLSY